jgi:phosphotransferase system HPr (HPr) family protein
LHARAATEVAKLARRFQATLVMVKGRQRADCGDVLQILSLGAAVGETLVLEATGEDAEAALEALAELLHNQFDEDLTRDDE